jgi:ABC-type nitrate/sulfonate/bicarbonate transport system ATPase subunit
MQDTLTEHGRRSARAPASANMLELRELVFSYPRGIEVLDHISLSIAPGEIVGIVGPSGCGKSTLLYLIAGLYTPISGAIERRPVSGDRHPLSMVFQKDTLLPWLTTAENVRFFARFKKKGVRRWMKRFRPTGEQKALDRRVDALLEMVHLEDRAAAFPYQLSGGMRRRLQFLAGVAPRPEILLLDEPFSSVDEPTRIGIHQDVFEVIRSLKMTTILVTHDLAEAITLCDRLVILSKRPAVIAAEHRIPFGEQRDMLHIRNTREYLDVYGRLWSDLSKEIGSSVRLKPDPIS